MLTILEATHLPVVRLCLPLKDLHQPQADRGMETAEWKLVNEWYTTHIVPVLMPLICHTPSKHSILLVKVEHSTWSSPCDSMASTHEAHNFSAAQTGVPTSPHLRALSRTPLANELNLRDSEVDCVITLLLSHTPLDFSFPL